MEENQRRALQAPIPASAVTQRKQSGQMLDYVEGWWVIDRMNEIFGNGSWGSELVTIEHVATVENEGKHTVTYRAVVRLSGPFTSQMGVGFASNTSRALGDAHETAGKSAETDALKRAAMKLGRHLGLALYEKPDEHGERTHVVRELHPTAQKHIAAFDLADSPDAFKAADAAAKVEAWDGVSRADYAEVVNARRAAVERIKSRTAA